MKASETILLSFFVIFSGVLLVNSTDMPYSSGYGFGAGFLPVNMSLAVIVLTGIIALRALLNKKKTPGEKSEQSTDSRQAPGPEKQKSFIAPISTIVLLLIATALMGFGSVLLPMAILMIIVSALFLGNTWFQSIRMTLVTLAVIYLIFSVWLGIPIN